MLNDRLMKSFHLRSSFPSFIPHQDKRIISMKFSNDGEKLVASSNYNNLKIYNCDIASQEYSLMLNKYGSGITDFMDTNDRVLITSTKRSHSVRELNVEKNAYQTKYDGHSGLVTSLSVHREKRFFLTGSEDKSVLLWDFRCQNPQNAQTDMADVPLTAFEPKGDMFIIGLQSKLIELYDIRGLGYGPFNEFKINPDESKWTSMKFSPTGEQILISSSGTKIRLIDSVFGKLQQVYGCKSKSKMFLFI